MLRNIHIILNVISLNLGTENFFGNRRDLLNFDFERVHFGLNSTPQICDDDIFKAATDHRTDFYLCGDVNVKITE